MKTKYYEGRQIARNWSEIEKEPNTNLPLAHPSFQPTICLPSQTGTHSKGGHVIKSRSLADWKIVINSTFGVSKKYFFCQIRCYSHVPGQYPVERLIRISEYLYRPFSILGVYTNVWNWNETFRKSSNGKWYSFYNWSWRVVTGGPSMEHILQSTYLI